MTSLPRRVLLIEDNPRDADIVCAALAAAGSPNAPRHAVTLGEGLLLLAREKPEVVLLDLTLPDALELEGLAQIQAVAPGLPVIALAKEENEDAAARAVERGAADYVLKDRLDGGILAHAIRNVVEREALRHKVDAMTLALKVTQADREHLARIDPQTDLLNRQGFQEALAREAQWAAGRGGDLLVTLINLDNFRQINDALGHAVGDVVLKETARKFRAALRATDYAARIGGDEFMALLPQTRPLEGMRIAEKLRMAISGTPIVLSSGSVRVTASLALLKVPPRSAAIEEILSQAHWLLRRAKVAGKNRVVYEWAAPAEAERSDFVPQVLSALQRGDRFRALRHGIRRLDDEREIGVEILTRATIGDFEMPADFFRVAYEGNVLTLVDHLCFKSCLAAAARIDPALACHVNLFPSTLLGIPTAQLIEAIPPGRPAGSICVEVSEAQIIGDPSYLVEPLSALRGAGLEIAIDDVGFGRSCLENLILLEPDVIKIDKKCVSGIAGNVPQERALKRLLAVVESLGAEAVAEGIETAAERDTLKALGSVR